MGLFCGDISSFIRDPSSTTRIRFSQYYVGREREPATFWREIVIAVVIRRHSTTLFY